MFIIFLQAEKYLYNELSISLGMSFEDTKAYIIKKVSELAQHWSKKKSKYKKILI